MYHPPKLAKLLLRLISFQEKDNVYLGDIEEMFYEQASHMGQRRARRWYWREVMKTLPKFIAESIRWRCNMFMSYLKIALRNIKKYKGYSLIKIAGLAIGMACTILILMWVQDELSYDKFYRNSDRIYRVSRVFYENDGLSIDRATAGSPPAIGYLLKNDYPQDINELVRILGNRSFRIIDIDGKKFKEERLFHAEENFFKIFTLPFIEGNSESALKGPGNVVITESISRKYFGNENPIGKVIELDNEGDLKISGVIKDVPNNSHFKFDLIVSMSTLFQRSILSKDMLATGSDWRHNWFLTYVLLNENVFVEKFEAGISELMERHVSPRYTENSSNKIGFQLQALETIHLHSHRMSELEENGRIEYVYIFSAIAILILLLACINFMNLATARSLRRSKEIGMRKVCGATKSQIIRQFLTESAVVSFAAFLLAILFVHIVLPFFNEFTAKNLTLNFSTDMSVYIALIIICIVTGLLAGSYPAFFISSFSPVSVLKNMENKSKNGISIRRILVIAQFTISITLITCLGVISRQMSYLKNIDLGYNRDNLIIISLEGISEQNFESFKSKLLQNQSISNVGSSNLIPTHPLWNSSNARTLDGDNPGRVPFRIANVNVNYDFLDTYQIKMAAGRNFSRNYSTDSTAFLLNETAVKELGWGQVQNAVNRPFEYGGERGRIIGVVKDIHFESLHNEIRSTIYMLAPSDMRKVAIRIESGNLTGAIGHIKEVWEEYQPHGIFEHSFLDATYNNLYKSENNLSKVVELFAILAIIIACLGLLGLTSFTVQQRTKEIGIRKVLGASVHGIINLLLKEFTVLVCLANIVAWPVAYYFMSKWLQKFAYSTGVSIWILIASGITALFIALVTVSWQAGRAALANPVNSLRDE